VNVSSPYTLNTTSASLPLARSASCTSTPAEALDSLVTASPAAADDIAQVSALHRLAIAGGLALAGLAALPQAASAAQPPREPMMSQAQVASDSTHANLAQTLGLTAKGAARLAHDKSLQGKAQNLPDMAKDMFASYTPAQRHLLYKAISEHSSAGLISIDNREAFVTGKALGHDAFPTIWVNIETIAQEQGLDKAQAHELKNHFLVMTTFSAADREAIASLIEADQAP
jgi:hypothetical protein